MRATASNSPGATVRHDTVYAIWLRDNSPNPDARHANGQKLFDITDIDDSITIENVANGAGMVEIRFSPDGHEARYDVDWLRQHAAPLRATHPRRLWGAELADAMPVFRYGDVTGDDDAKRAWLAAISELGFALLRETPCETETVCHIAELFGYVRETNYGRFFEVRTEPDPDQSRLYADGPFVPHGQSLSRPGARPAAVALSDRRQRWR